MYLLKIISNFRPRFTKYKLALSSAAVLGLILGSLVFNPLSGDAAVVNWGSTPVDLSGTGQSAGIDLQLTNDPSGNLFAIWSRSNGTNSIIQTSTKPVGGSWSSPVDLSATGQDSVIPQISSDSYGNVMAIWRRSTGVDTGVIETSFKLSSSNSWSSPEVISTVGKYPQLPQISAIPASTTYPLGAFAAVWGEWNRASVYEIKASIKPLGSNWETTETLATGASGPQITSDFEGNLTALWTQLGSSVVSISYKPVGQPWETSVSLTSNSSNLSSTNLATDSQGNVTALWVRHNGTLNVVQSAFKPYGGSWSAPIDLSSTAVNVLTAQLAVSPSGVATAVWNQSTVVQSSSRPLNGSWTTPVNISGTVSLTQYPQVTVDQTGIVTAVWARRSGTKYVIQGVSKPLNQSWETPVTLSVAGQNALFPQVTVDPNGQVAAIWLRSNGTNDIVQALQARAQKSVVFDPNGGSGNMATQFGFTSTALSQNTFTREGWSFSRWDTAHRCDGFPFSDGAQYSFDESVTLYACWVGNTSTINYDLNGGTGTVPLSGTYTSGDSAALVLPNSTNFAKTNYTFTGWNTLANGAGTSFPSGGSIRVTSNTTLFAQWSPNSFNVSYNLNYGTGTIPTGGSFTVGGPSLALASGTGFSRTGYTFTGWNTVSNGSGTSYASAGSFSDTASVVLYAQWSPNTYTFSYDSNGGTGSAPQNQSYTTGASSVSISDGDYLFRNAFQFSNWNTAANANGIDFFASSQATISENTILFAIWAPVLTYDANTHLVNVSFTGQAMSSWRLNVGTTQFEFGNGSTDLNGIVSTSRLLPAGLSTGLHEVSLHVVDKSGNQVVHNLWVLVDRNGIISQTTVDPSIVNSLQAAANIESSALSSQLARTGAQENGTISLAAVLIFAGIMFLTFGRKRFNR